VAGSHSRAVLSALAVASSRPSGLNATPLTSLVWPVRVRRCSPVAGSHSRAVPSALAVASIRPSGLNATLRTQLSCPVRVLVRARWAMVSPSCAVIAVNRSVRTWLRSA